MNILCKSVLPGLVEYISKMDEVEIHLLQTKKNYVDKAPKSKVDQCQTTDFFSIKKSTK